MYQRVRKQFSPAALVLSIMAIVLALGGAAIAAAGLTKSQEKQVTKIAKKYAGKNGENGAPGTNGTNGSPGAKGDPGEKGEHGENGKSVVLTAEPNGANCEKGGTKVEVEGNAASKEYVCNGKNGTNGTTGFTETLPEKKTETGIWGTGPGVSVSNTGRHTFPISFPIPLSEAPEPIIVQPTENSTSGCPGRGGGAFPPSGEFEPTIPEAGPGKLCIYLDKMVNTSPVSSGSLLIPVYEGGAWYEEPGVSPTGTFFEVICTADCTAMGSWAVTGPEQ